MRVPQIISQLSAFEAPVVDRATCEALFCLKRRRAITLMQHFGGYRVGNASLLDRLALLIHLRQLKESPHLLHNAAEAHTPILISLHEY